MRGCAGASAAAVIALLSAHPGRAQTPAADCAALSSLRVPAARIGLPTRGAEVLQASLQPPSQAAAHPTPGYCKVTGAIRPIDPAAPDIRFELDLPIHWNGKAILLGGGGFDGSVPDTSGPLLGLPITRSSPPLLRGYATFGSDSGHQAANQALPTPAVDGAFAMNDEALANYAGDALKKTHDVALALIGRRYGRAPARVYVAGGSNGGREALLAAERWPADYDGVIAAFPFWQAGTNALAFGALYRAFAPPGAYPNVAKRALAMRAAIRQCDRLDGLADGLVADVEACRFDPRSLRCPGGADTGDTCLSDEQIAALRIYASPFAFPAADGGVRRYPAFTALSGGEIADPTQLGTEAPRYPPTAAMPLWALFWDQFARYAIARDPAFDPGDLDPAHPGRWAGRLDAVVDLLDLQPDLAAFAARGGKLIVYHGLADPLVSHRSSVELRSRLIERMGTPRVRAFARFYGVPGFGHGAGSFLPAWDPLAVLEAWVERREPPTRLSIDDASPSSLGRKRPLCELGAWPRYDGRGDPARTSSFTCHPDPRAHP